MLDRIFNYRSPSSTTTYKTDCSECRIIGGGGLLGLGGYIMYYSFKKRNSPSTNKFAIFASGFLGSVVMTLGTFRLFGLNDVKQQQQQQQTTSKQDQINDAELLKE